MVLHCMAYCGDSEEKVAPHVLGQLCSLQPWQLITAATGFREGAQLWRCNAVQWRRPSHEGDPRETCRARPESTHLAGQPCQAKGAQ